MLTSVADIKTLLEIAAGDTDDDALLSTILDANDAYVKKYCRRSFESSTFTEYHDGCGVETLRVNEWPIISITSIHDDTAHEWGSDTEIASTDILSYSQKNKDAGIVELDGVNFANGRQNVKIVYVGGFSTTDLGTGGKAADLVDAVKRLCQADYLSQKTALNSTGDSETDPDEIRDRAHKKLDKYRRLDDA